MKKLFLLPALVALTSCNTPSFGVATVKPIYGWTDGCTEVRVGGAGFDPAATVSFGGAQVEVTARGEGADAGYWMNVYTPTSPTGSAGDVDVVVTSGSNTETIPAAFHYVQCPDGGTVESVYTTSSIPEPLDPWIPATPSNSVSPGTDVTILGCGMDASALRVVLYQECADPKTGALATTGVASDPIPLQSICGMGKSHFTVPTLPECNEGGAQYDVVLLRTDDSIFYPAGYGDCSTDTAGSKDSGALPPCLPLYTLAYSGK